MTTTHQPREVNTQAQYLAQSIHEIIQRMPESKRADAYSRMIELMLMHPRADKTDFMTCLAPGVQNMQAGGV
jgi:hypothetical protein